ncbi:phosphoribosyl-ATP pyrophosphatase /phosphoribosyl-AMP cyclohydrolase [Amphibacillus marinus]|uniref:Histidine biosynthesis bifunctional protein HisIE n=1 Tax=Amphibacillus marinus TaxID=872970 RepID=A0A1H8GVD4_9BACI|nr:bifunctional phosphoribosyl-AMP cyclohydrolase/phosphoribosyl-ATP diphosphatase HisIE [Amphibacillus marinus]SEN47684.1 phosphoribosyl-ATP pyrophosphatase /phosphoribosyl-AMP cyclohydrolase [Amphibacillus marinus]
MKPNFSKGLVPAIIVDARTKDVLTLAYMNEKSYHKTLETNETWFYSRSRQELWHKGATSGNTQKVVSLTLDCDQDALLVEVIPKGPACHKGTTSCFTEVVKEQNQEDFDANIINRIVTEISERKLNPQSDSYTNYLFNKGIDKISKKLIEEAGEVVIAAKNRDKTEVTLEVSDLLYHTFVLLEEQGVPFNQIKTELTKRFAKKGNNKGDRPKIEQW